MALMSQQLLCEGSFKGWSAVMMRMWLSLKPPPAAAAAVMRLGAALDVTAAGP